MWTFVMANVQVGHCWFIQKSVIHQLRERWLKSHDLSWVSYIQTVVGLGISGCHQQSFFFFGECIFPSWRYDSPVSHPNRWKNCLQKVGSWQPGGGDMTCRIPMVFVSPISGLTSKGDESWYQEPTGVTSHGGWRILSHEFWSNYSDRKHDLGPIKCSV